MHKVRLALVSFAAERDRASLSAALDACGYVHDCLSAADWSDEAAATAARPSVLLLGRDGREPSGQTWPRFERLPSRVLGVFCCDSLPPDDGVLGRCTDFVGWPCHADELQLRLQRVFGDADARRRSIGESRLIEEFVDLNMLGQSREFIAALKLIRQFARCDAPVLIEGETGTGKELAARAVHYLNSRRDNAFIPTNCGAIPEDLVENELFGHEKGAYTSAINAQPGLVEQARDGTLFLDEIDTLSPRAQVSLLRFLGDQEYRPLGSKTTSKTDVRIISATNADLPALVRRGKFREDLLFRLNVLSVRLPPLRRRGGDIGLLAQHFVELFSNQYDKPIHGIHPDTLAWMNQHPWDGNVRELENLVHRACLLADGPQIHLPALAPQPAGATASPEHPDGWCGQSFREAKARTLDAFEKSYLSWLMAETGGNISAAARQSGKERNALRKLLNKHGIDKSAFADHP